MAGTIICYGDSNTYGYDPRSYLGERYEASQRWPEILAAETGWNVLNCGQNGRCIPSNLSEIEHVINFLPKWSKESAPVWLWIMLGSNDLLRDPFMHMSAEAVAGRMENFLKKLLACDEVAGGEETSDDEETAEKEETADDGSGEDKIRLRLISPAYLRRGQWVESDEVCRESEKMDDLYRGLAARLGIAFTCAGEWDIPVLFDGVHFSEEGNRKFADCIKKELALP